MSTVDTTSPSVLPNGQVGQVLARHDERIKSHEHRLARIEEEMESLEKRTAALERAMIKLETVSSDLHAVRKLTMQTVAMGVGTLLTLIGNLIYWYMTKGG